MCDASTQSMKVANRFLARPVSSIFRRNSGKCSVSTHNNSVDAQRPSRRSLSDCACEQNQRRSQDDEFARVDHWRVRHRGGHLRTPHRGQETRAGHSRSRSQSANDGWLGKGRSRVIQTDRLTGDWASRAFLSIARRFDRSRVNVSLRDFQRDSMRLDARQPTLRAPAWKRSSAIGRMSPTK